MQLTAVILAAGSGVRLGTDTPKQLVTIAGKTIIEHSVLAFSILEQVDQVVIVTRGDLIETVEGLFPASADLKVDRIVEGGVTRSESTRAALSAIDDIDDARVLVHDAVRPLIEAPSIIACIDALDRFDAVTLAIPLVDTIIEVDRNVIAGIPDRDGYRRVQTPQGFRLSVLRQAHQRASQDPSFAPTDDCGVVARYLPEVAIGVVDGSESNMKVTLPIDIQLAEDILRRR